MWRRRFIVLFVIAAGLAFLRWLSRDRAERAALRPFIEPQASETPLTRSVTQPVDPPVLADAGLTHVDPQRRAEMLRQLIALLLSDAAPSTDGGDPAIAGPPRFRTSSDGKTTARFIQERVRSDFVPMAKGCYEDFLRRKPEAEGSVVFAFEIMGDESVGGVVSSAEIRDESTLRDPSLDTCLRESFLSVYFDPPPGGGVLHVVYPFRFATGDPPPRPAQ